MLEALVGQLVVKNVIGLELVVALVVVASVLVEIAPLV